MKEQQAAEGAAEAETEMEEEGGDGSGGTRLRGGDEAVADGGAPAPRGDGPVVAAAAAAHIKSTTSVLKVLTNG